MLSVAIVDAMRCRFGGWVLGKSTVCGCGDFRYLKGRWIQGK